MILRLAAILLILFGCPAVFIFGQTSTGHGSTITPGALVGLAATWIGIVMGYVNLRRSMKNENVETIRTEAKRIADELFSARASTLMDRREQEVINRHNEERYKAQASVSELAREIRYLAEQIRTNAAKQV